MLYIVGGRRTLPERLFWFIVTVLGFILAAIMLNKSVTDWIEHPTGHA